jgi:hypothetical protein
MGILLLIIGVIALAYWGYCMTLPNWDRPTVILKNGGVVFLIGIALLVAGLFI